MDLNAPRLGFTGGPGEFYAPPADYQRSPDAPIPDDDLGVFNTNLTSHLRWSVLDPPAAAKVLELDDAGKPCWRPLFSAPNHPLADGPVTQPPRSRMLVVFTLVHYWESWHDGDVLDQRPAPLVIENPDGQPITFGQFIDKLHGYALELRNVIFEIEDRDDREHARLYCISASGVTRKEAGDPNAEFVVDLRSDCHLSEQELEKRWIWQEERFAKEAGRGR